MLQNEEKRVDESKKLTSKYTQRRNDRRGKQYQKECWRYEYIVACLQAKNATGTSSRLDGMDQNDRDPQSHCHADGDRDKLKSSLETRKVAGRVSVRLAGLICEQATLRKPRRQLEQDASNLQNTDQYMYVKDERITNHDHEGVAVEEPRVEVANKSYCESPASRK